MAAITKNRFPPVINNLLRSLSEVGFFDRSLLIGSWVMPIYAELYDIKYIMRTLDIDFAVHVAHAAKMRSDLEKLLTDLGFIDFMAAQGVQKFTGEGYEIEFIAHRSGGRDPGALLVKEWNVAALPLPFISMPLAFSEQVEIDDFCIRIPLPEAFFIHKLIIAQKRLTETKKLKDLEQCAVLVPILEESRLTEVMRYQRISREKRNMIKKSCETIDFSLHKINS